MTDWILLGTTDEEPLTCGQCGKPHLKRLVALQHHETGEERRVGTTCATRLLGPLAGSRVDAAIRIQDVVDRLRKDGTERTLDWSRRLGLGCSIREFGPPGKPKGWRLSLYGEAPLRVTHTAVEKWPPW